MASKWLHLLHASYSHTSRLISIKELSQQGPGDTLIFLNQNWITSHFLSKSLWCHYDQKRRFKLRGFSETFAEDEVSLSFPEHMAAQRRVKAQSQSSTSKEEGTWRRFSWTTISVTLISPMRSRHTDTTVSKTSALISNLTCTKPVIICTFHVSNCIWEHFHVIKSLVRNLGEVFHSFFSYINNNPRFW